MATRALPMLLRLQIKLEYGAKLTFCCADTFTYVAHTADCSLIIKKTGIKAQRKCVIMLFLLHPDGAFHRQNRSDPFQGLVI